MGPALRMLCRSFEEWKMIDPGPRRLGRPFCSVSTVPSFTISSSSSGCRCGACDTWFTPSVVIWISSSSSVGVGARSTSRLLPVGVGFASRPAHSKTVDFWICFCAASVANEPSTAAVVATTHTWIVRIVFLSGVRTRSRLMAVRGAVIQGVTAISRDLLRHAALP